MQVLKLNAAYMPLGIISWMDAIRLVEKGKAEVVESYKDQYLNSYKEAYEMPCVIRLLHFVAPKKNLKFYKPFTRRNVYYRDGGLCAYCGDKVSLSKMTYDHVKPKAYGGITTWANIVTCCFDCNQKKRGRTPEEAGMKLKIKPYAPLVADNFNGGMIRKLKDKMESMKGLSSKSQWLSYLYWTVELDE